MTNKESQAEWMEWKTKVMNSFGNARRHILEFCMGMIVIC